MINIEALSLADLQKFAWLQTQLEADGVRSLSEARSRIENILREKHRIRQRRDLAQPATRTDYGVCPVCGGVTTEYLRADDISKETCRIRQCDGVNGVGGCRYSTIIEVS